MANPLDLSHEDWERAERLRSQYAELVRQRELLTTDMHTLDWQFFRITRGWLSKVGSELHAVRVSRFAKLTAPEKAELGQAIVQYIAEKGGECLALEIAEVFGRCIPDLAYFMRRYVPETIQIGERRSTVYRLRTMPDDDAPAA